MPVGSQPALFDAVDRLTRGEAAPRLNSMITLILKH
jgi:hypothetical protein